MPKLVAFQAATASIGPDTPADQAKTLLRQALPLLVDLSPTELEDAFADLEARAPLPKNWLKALRREVKDTREAQKKNPPPAPDSGPTPEEELKELQPLAAPLAASPDILWEVVKALRSLGLAGQEREAKLLFLALTTRNFNKPVNVAVKGASSGGKNTTVETTLKLFPAQAYYALSAMSEKALAYSQEPLCHRFLIIYEAAGLGSEFAQYLFRSLLSEGRVRYETVENTRDGLKPRLIEREGPTGFITTTTRVSLHGENETRLLSIEIDDSPEQTRAVLLSQAAQESGGPAPDLAPDLAPFHALQRILEITRPEVTIPYATPLAIGCNPQAVRLRRDFPTVLNLVKAHAVLHAAHRRKDEQGRIIAEPGDYEAVYDLVADIVSYGHGAKADPKVRDLVAVVERLADDEGISVKVIAQEMGFYHLRTWRLVQKALKDEFLRNLETRKRQPARLVVGDPIPPDGAVLPSPEKILRQYPPENGENVKKESDSQDISEGSRFHPPMKTLENATDTPPGVHPDEAGFTPFSPTYENDNLSESQEKDAAFSRFHGFPGDKQKTFFEDEPATPDVLREVEL